MFSRPSKRRKRTRWLSTSFETLENRCLLSAVADPVAWPTADPLGGSIPAGQASPPGFSPAQILNAYGVSGVKFNGVSGTGAGQTIAIVASNDNPNFVDSTNPAFNTSDLHRFDAAMGLPDPPSFTKVDQTGGTNYPPLDYAWANEIALDVEWTHAIAPQASILLVEASSANLSDLISTAANYARSAPGVSVVSMSFAVGEFSGESQYNQYFTTPSGHAGVTFVAASGDGGDPGGYPAFSPEVVSVGATTLSLSGNSYGSEVGYKDSGGGISQYESKPAYQASVKQSSLFRTIPDVAFEGNPNTGVSVYDSLNGGSATPWYKIGGTSFSAPAWAGLIAIANQGRAVAGLTSMDGSTQTLPKLYSVSSSDFHDITSGTTIGSSPATAGAGYDLVTGRGSPVANLLIPDLVGIHVTTGTITGSFYNDANSNGVADKGEGTLSGFQAYLDVPGVGHFVKGDPIALSNSSGKYSFTGLSPGKYVVGAITPTSWRQTPPPGPVYTITIAAGSSITVPSFGFTQKIWLYGSVFNDANKNGKLDSTEKGLAGWTVYIDANHNGKLDSGEVSTTTNSSGYWSIMSLPAGTYQVRIVPKSGWKLTDPSAGFYSFTVGGGGVRANVLFGEFA
jgi:subtilase family serine protease